MTLEYELDGIYVSFYHIIETQFSTRIKIFKSDSSSEYLSPRFHNLLSHKELFLNSVLIRKGQTKSISECKYHLPLDTICTLLYSSTVALSFRGEDFLTDMHVTIPPLFYLAARHFKALFHHKPEYSTFSVYMFYSSSSRTV